METFRCPTCLFVLVEPDPRRCPSCHKRLGRRRARPIVLGDKFKFGANPPPHIVDLVHLERIDASEEPVNAVKAETPANQPAGATPAPPVASTPDDHEPIHHTTMFEPSQFDPEMREVLDGLYRKARAELSDEGTAIGGVSDASAKAAPVRSRGSVSTSPPRRTWVPALIARRRAPDPGTDEDT